jgi:hypothetical protein
MNEEQNDHGRIGEVNTREDEKATTECILHAVKEAMLFYALRIAILILGLFLNFSCGSSDIPSVCMNEINGFMYSTS